MRYHVGLGIGHVYAHGLASAHPHQSFADESEDEEPGDSVEEPEPHDNQIHADSNAFAAASDDESSSIECDVEDIEDRESESDDEQWVAMEYMYGRR